MTKTKIPKTKTRKQYSSQVLSRNYLKREPQTTIRAHQRVALEKSHNFAFWIAQIGWEMRELRELEVLELLLKICIILQIFCNFSKIKNPDGVLRSRSEPRARKRDMQPYQIRYSRLNGAVEISIRGHFDKKWVPLPKAILSQNPQKGSERYRKPPDTKEGSI